VNNSIVLQADIVLTIIIYLRTAQKRHFQCLADAQPPLCFLARLTQLLVPWETGSHARGSYTYAPNRWRVDGVFGVPGVLYVAVADQPLIWLFYTGVLRVPDLIRWVCILVTTVAEFNVEAFHIDFLVPL
jgi:hypothetical protein